MAPPGKKLPRQEHSSILAREIPKTREPDGLQPLASQRVGQD